MEQIDGVRFQKVHPENRIPALAEPVRGGVDLVRWAGEHRDLVESKLDFHGAVLFRNFDVADAPKFLEFSRAVAHLLDYAYRSTPRTTVDEKLYTSTEYPPKESIPMHCENAFQRDWPTKLLFYCAQPAPQGGRTPLADVAAVTERIDGEVRQKFQDKGVMYVRNYGSGFDLPWQTVFQTKEKSEVEAYCREQDIEFEWRSGDKLRTRQVCQAMAAHPRGGQMLWFNQAHLFHYSSLDEDTRGALLSFFQEEELPRNAFYGDGSALEPDVLASIREAFEHHSTSFPWHKGDILAVDNMAVAHGRTPYSGPRKVLVTMGDLYSTVVGK